MKRSMVFDVLLLFFCSNTGEFCCNAQEQVSLQNGSNDISKNTIRYPSSVNQVYNGYQKPKPSVYPETKPSQQYLSTSSPTSSRNSSNTENCGTQKQYPTRPCPSTELQCVKDYFQKHSKCKTDENTPSNVLEIDFLRLPIPYLNLSVFQSNVKFGGLNSGRIYDFIVDDITDIIVLTVCYYNVTISGNSEFIYYRTAMEPLSITGFTSEFYPTVIITSIWKGVQNLEITKSIDVANITQVPIYNLGRCIQNTQDPTLKSLFATFNANVRVVVQESYQVRARLIQMAFIQDNICNLGSKYTSNE